MKLHDLRPQPGSQHRRRRVGRGISAGQGASCGFGMRGQKSRSGRSTRPGFEGGQNPLYRRLPKLHGFRAVNPTRYTILNVGDLARLGRRTTRYPGCLTSCRLGQTAPGGLKILGKGELNRPLTVVAAAFSATAEAKITAAGGQCQRETPPSGNSRL
jgi:large subunit ribosomal protein L15